MSSLLLSVTVGCASMAGPINACMDVCLDAKYNNV